MSNNTYSFYLIGETNITRRKHKNDLQKDPVYTDINRIFLTLNLTIRIQLTVK